MPFPRNATCLPVPISEANFLIISHKLLYIPEFNSLCPVNRYFLPQSSLAPFYIIGMEDRNLRLSMRRFSVRGFLWNYFLNCKPSSSSQLLRLLIISAEISYQWRVIFSVMHDLFESPGTHCQVSHVNKNNILIMSGVHETTNQRGNNLCLRENLQ